MLFPLLKTRYTQLGGLRLVRQYAKMGLLWPAAKKVLRHPFSKQTYKQVYLDTVRKVEPTLVKEYRPVMKDIADRVRNEGTALEHKRTKKIWFCWLQGLGNAPEVVKACYNSLVHGEWLRSHRHRREQLARVYHPAGLHHLPQGEETDSTGSFLRPTAAGTADQIWRDVDRLHCALHWRGS